jgi:hypothetical protein
MSAVEMPRNSKSGVELPGDGAVSIGNTALMRPLRARRSFRDSSASAAADEAL